MGKKQSVCRKATETFQQTTVAVIDNLRVKKWYQHGRQ